MPYEERLANRRDGHRTDQRDKEINRLGERTGQWFVMTGALAAMVLALVEGDWFWIANVLYLCFVLSAVLSSATRLAAYRRDFSPW
ncbi:hypothetical protein [Cellulomonas sp. URHB0016]